MEIILELDIFTSIPILKYKKIENISRCICCCIISIHIFELYQIPQNILYPIMTLLIMQIISITIEKTKLSTVEVAKRKCPKCNKSMYSKIIRCDKCNIEQNLDNETNI